MAKNALSMLKRFDVYNQYPLFYLDYYGRFAWRFEPLQVCADELRRAFEAALSLGQVQTAFHCAAHSIKTSIFSGSNLKSILKEIDYYLHLLKTYKSEVSKNFLLIFRETVCLLIDNGKTNSIESAPCVGDLNDPANKQRESALFHKAMQCMWIGHAQRFRYYSEKRVLILARKLFKVLIVFSLRSQTLTILFAPALAQLSTYLSQFYHGKTIDMINEYWDGQV